MKILILLMLTVSSAWAKPLIMISYFDAFNRAPFNNSERIAHALKTRLGVDTSEVRITLCALNTVFEKGYAQTENCLKALTEQPVMVLGLGESNCDLKIETMMRNLDKTLATPDNAGNHRDNSPIVAGAPAVIGLRYPLPEMYCALESNERNDLVVSNNAGSFVCNNTAFLMTHFHPEIQYGFIHVPANFCGNLGKKTENAIISLEKMIKRAASFLSADTEDEGLPHTNNEIRLSTKKVELNRLRDAYKRKDKCLHEFLKASKGDDEKKTFLGIRI